MSDAPSAVDLTTGEQLVKQKKNFEAIVIIIIIIILVITIIITIIKIIIITIINQDFATFEK